MWGFGVEVEGMRLDKTHLAELFGVAARQFGVVRRMQMAHGIPVICHHGEEEGETGEEEDWDGAETDESYWVVAPDTTGVAVDMRWRHYLSGYPGRVLRLGQCEVCRAVWLYEEERGDA